MTNRLTRLAQAILLLFALSGTVQALSLTPITIPPPPPKPVRRVVPESPVPDSPEFRALVARGHALFEEIPYDAAHHFSVERVFEAAQAYAAAQKLRPGDGETAMRLAFCVSRLANDYMATLMEHGSKAAQVRKQQFETVQEQAYNALFDAQALDPDSDMIQGKLDSLDDDAYLQTRQLRDITQAASQHPHGVHTRRNVPAGALSLTELQQASELIAQHQPEQALPHLVKATELQSDYFFAWNELGRLQLQLKQYPEAEASLRRALDLERTWPMLSMSTESMLGGALLYQGKTGDARAMLAQSLLHSPRYNNDAWRYLDEIAGLEHKPLAEFKLEQRVHYNPRREGYVASETVREEPFVLDSGAPTAHGIWLVYATNYRNIEAMTSQIHPRHNMLVIDAWRATFNAIDKSTLATPSELGSSDTSLNTWYRLYTEGWLDVAVVLFCNDASTGDDIAAGYIRIEPQRIIDFIDQTHLRGHFFASLK